MIVSRRHKKMTLKTRVVRKITDVDRDAWHKVYPDSLESYDFFKALDESNLDQFSFYYILVYDRSNLVGATNCFMLEYSLDTSINGPLRRLSNAVKRINPKIFSLKTLVCGMPMGQGRLGLRGDRDAVFRVMVRRMEQIAKKEKAAILAFKDFDQSYTPVLDTLQHQGFAKFDSLPTTMLNVWFRDFEEYINTLSAPNRYDLRRKFRKVGHVPFVFSEVERLTDKDLADVYRLYMQVVEKHEMGFEVLPMAFFANVPKNMPGRTRYFLWHLDEKLVAFLFCLVSSDMLIDYYVGMDYAVAHKYHLYFVKFRDVLNWCISHKIKRYEMGITGYEPKRRLGFDFVPLYLYAKLRNPVFRPIFNLICQFLKFENFDPSLKKAKKAQRREKKQPHA